jgi:hypothetical protein
MKEFDDFIVIEVTGICAAEVPLPSIASLLPGRLPAKIRKACGTGTS